MGEEAKVIVLESLLKKHKREEEWALASKELLNFKKKRAENRKQLNIYDIDGSPFLNHHFDDFYIPLARLYSADTTSICEHSNVCSFCKLPIVGINVRSMWNSVGFYQIAKLSMILVSCFLEIVLDKVRYSRDTKLSIVLVLLGVGLCTVTDVNVNAKGFCCCMEYFSATILCTSSTT